jgi:hypothetical protein
VVTAVEHLGQALRALEAEASEIEHRMSFVRAAIEAFGLDADSLLLDVIAEEERTVLRIDVPEAVVLPNQWSSWAFDDIAARGRIVADAPETAQQDGPEPPYGRTPEGRWDWHVIAQEIGKADAVGSRRALWLMDEFEVPATTAQWMVKRCREQGLIDADRPAVNHQAARDAAAAAL